MTNVDSSWEASVMKLAQAGNLKAITFWINRHLVPQGMCAQVTNGPSGELVIQMVCRQAPDAEQIMHFLCHRLCKLNTDSIRQVQVTAQMVGSPEILWKKTARILPPAARSEAQKPGVAQGQATVQAPVLVGAAVGTAESEARSVAVKPVQPQISKPEKPRVKPRPVSTPIAQPITQIRTAPRDWRGQLDQQLTRLKIQTTDLTERSIRWFSDQKPAVRGLMLGGSALTAFLIGCGFELAGYYADPNAFQRSKATFTGILQKVPGPLNAVETASGRIPVIHQPVLNPEDPTISLIFSNNATLTRLPANQPPSSPVADAPPPLITEIENYRLADMLVTNLSSPLSLSLPVTEAARKTADLKPDTETPDLQAPELEASSLDNPESERGIEDPVAAPESAELPAEAEVESGEEFAPDLELLEELLGQSKLLTPRELTANGVDVVNLAADTVIPNGATQLSETVSALEQNGVHAVGAGANLPEARRPQIFEVKGKRIAYLGYSDSSPQAVTDSTAGINVGVNQQMEEDIKTIREQVDWIVVNFNWNRQLKAYPEDWQAELAHAAIDHGADLVVGYHPTMTQGAEIYNGRAIVYSLGNAVDEYSEKPAGDYETAALKVTLKDHVMELEFLPIQVKKGQAEVAKGELGMTIMQYLEQASSLFDHPLRSL